MEPLRAGQAVTYFDSQGTAHAATVVEPYARAALIACDMGNVTALRLQFEDPGQPFPYLSDADGGAITEQSFEGPIAEE